ncbi:MAG: PASTA domain-containing protein [Bacilli bacterium]|nr:PASTA domain-containing protein [Bacilli bacterium]
MNKKGRNKFIIALEIILLIIGIVYFIGSIVFIDTNKIFHAVNSFLIVAIIVLFIMDDLEKSKVLYKILFILAIIFLIAANVLNYFNLFEKKEIVIEDLTALSMNEALDWASLNNIVIEQSYEYSDNVPEFGIISQNVIPGTPLKEVTTVKLVISLGPNYDKSVIIPDLSGMTLDDLLETKNELFLNNVVINYEINSEFPKNTIISQSIKGQYTRNTKITFTLSLGSETTPVEMIDLKNMTLFDATLWLKENGINYKLTYEFDENINRNYIISQDTLEGTTVDSNSTVNLIVSKGKSIIVPNLLSMTSDEVVKWIIANNLKIEFSDTYDVSAPLGSIISANYNENDEVEVGTVVKIVTSKGQLKMPEFNSLSEFRKWASNYNINYSEEYQMNESVSKGSIINFSVKAGDVIDINASITVYVSNGAPVTVPNFYGMSSSSITSTCNSYGLNCTFYQYGYTDKASGIAVVQNIKAGSTVISGTYVSIGLSKGVAQTFTVRINQSSIQSCVGNATCTINYLKQLFASSYPGVTINYLEKTSSTFDFAGNIHESSPIKDGSTVTQGKTYEIWITKS